MSSEPLSVPSETPPVQKREIFGWAMYDFANSSYTTIVTTVIYSAFFTSFIIPPGSETRDTYWSVAIIISTIVALILSPLVGALCDYSGQKKRYLALTTMACSLATIGLAFVQPGDIWLAIVLITISNAGFMLGESFCASFLPELATPKNMGVISGLGWALGYMGGLISLSVCFFLLISADKNDPAQADLYIQQTQMAMVFTGIFYFLTALPTFLLVKKRDKPSPGFENAPLGKLMRAGLKETAQSFSLARAYPTLFKFFLAFTVYMAGLEVIIKFIGIYANNELKLSQGDLTKMFLIVQVSAAIGAVAFGFLETRFGAKPTVLACILWWIAGIFMIYFLDPISAMLGAQPTNVFFFISIIAGSGIGSIQSSSRTVVGLLSPPERSAQMFGFWGLFSRLAIILGMSFGFFADFIGSRRHALLLVAAFFIIGGIMLFFIDLPKHNDPPKSPEPAHQ